MKRILAFALGIVCCFSLAACGNKDEVKLPSSDYEKVQFAFNGVERSLNGSNSSKRSKANTDITLATPYGEPARKLMANTINADDISTIYGALSVEKETSNPDFEYDEPPMIQFQYMKALYEEVGEGFEFGTKYSYAITGEINYDFANRESTDDQKFLNRYTMELSVLIDIDEADLITAEVGFDLTYSNGEESRHQKRYSELVLDYDMNEASPTYELTIIDLDDLLSFANDEEKYISAEYDYVNVEKNVIKEWRKFGVCSPEELSHYQNDSFVYKYSVLRAYKDNRIYRIENAFKKDARLKSAVLNGLGFIDELSRLDEFNRKQSTQNSKIQTVVNRFNNILGKDIVNSLVYTGATEKWESDATQNQENLFLRVESTGGYQLYDDALLINLFNPSVGWDEKGTRQHLTIYYKSGEEETLAEYHDFNALNVKVRSTSYDKTKWIDVADENVTFTEAIKQSGFIGYYDENNLDYQSMTLEFDISLKENPNVTLQSNFRMDLYNGDCYEELLSDWDLVDEYIDAYAPIEDAIPEFDQDFTGSIRFSPQIYGGANGTIGLYSKVGLASAVTEYQNKLKRLGFVENTSNSTYTKRVSDDYVLVLTVANPSEKEKSSAIRFEFKQSAKKQDTITDVLNELIGNSNVIIPDFEEELPGEYEYSVQDNLIRIETDNATLINSYVSLFSNIDYGFETYEYLGSLAAIKYVGGTIYRIRDMGKSIAVEKGEVSISLVGDFNSWNELDTTYDMAALSIENNDLCFTANVLIEANQAFKIVTNHSWDNGGYGFDIFAGSESFMFNAEAFERGENGNIIVKETCLYTIKVRFAFSYADPTHYSIGVAMIDIIKNK